MSGQMCWLTSYGSNEALILHLRQNERQPWLPYTLCREYAVPDYPIPGGSKGWATFQKLLKAGWEIIPTPRKEEKAYVGALQFMRS
jgi:hypothetical protein